MSPLALVTIGAGFEGKKAIAKIKPSLAASMIKLMVLPAIFLPIAVKLGFRDQALVALVIMLGSPTTPSSYIMAKNMGHEGNLSAYIKRCCYDNTAVICNADAVDFCDEIFRIDYVRDNIRSQ